MLPRPPGAYADRAAAARAGRAPGDRPRPAPAAGGAGGAPRRRWRAAARGRRRGAARRAVAAGGRGVLRGRGPLPRRRQPGDHLEHDAADGVQVLRRLRRRTARLLGRHVAVGADGARDRGEATVGDRRGDAEVAEPQVRRAGRRSPRAAGWPASRRGAPARRRARPTSPISSCSQSRPAVPASSGPCSRSRSATEPPGTSSMASTTRSSSAAQPWGATTCGWRTRTACSRTKRASSAELCWPSTLRATWRPRALVPRPPDRPHPAGPDLVEQHVAARDHGGRTGADGWHPATLARSGVRPGSSSTGRGAAGHGRPHAVHSRRTTIPAAGRGAGSLPRLPSGDD